MRRQRRPKMSLIDRATEKFMEKFFLSMISPFSVEDLENAVKADDSLLDAAMAGNPSGLSWAERAAKQFNGQSKFLTTENVLQWIADKRSDLYFSIITDFRKRRWLDRQVKEFKEYLFNY